MQICLLALGLAASILLNSLADNLPPDAHGVRHRPRWPHCQACGRRHRLTYWLAGAALLACRGRCEHCGAPRRLRQVMVELASGAGAVLLWVWADARVSAFLAAVIVGFVFLLITVIDMEHRLILHIVTLPAAAAISLLGSLPPGRGLTRTVQGGLAGFGLVLGLYVLGLLFSLAVSRLRGRALGEVAFGGGDVNLAGLIGLATGWPGVLLALLITVLTSGAFSLGYILIQSVRRRYVPFTPLPYGPFLTLGGMAAYLYSREIALWLASL